MILNIYYNVCIYDLIHDLIDLYYNDTERLSTTAIGATVFGDFIVAGVTTSGQLHVFMF